MRPQEIIRKKRDREELSDGEIKAFVSGVVSGAWAEYQSSALLMAIFLNGMTERERLSLTQEMLHSGDVLDFSSLKSPKVDKHSTGGVGDKTSLIIAPLAAAAGLFVPMISGRGLGHTGGTLDKLEAIPGFSVNLTLEDFKRVLAKVGFAMTGQTKEIAPADRKLYALRDVTSTVECVPLIAASIMSKKLAEGLDGLVLDVKNGEGAFMKTEADARVLAETLVQIGRGAGVRTHALVTDMNQPLGRAIGNRLEVIECLEVLKGRGAEDLAELSFELTAQMIVAGEGIVDDNVETKELHLGEARERVKRLCDGGAGLEKFRESIAAQGGDARIVDDYELMPPAKHILEVQSEEDGFVVGLNAEDVGVASMLLGAGRGKVEDIIDPAVGIILHKKIGDRVRVGESLAQIQYNDDAKLEESMGLLKKSYRFAAIEPERAPLIKFVL